MSRPIEHGSATHLPILPKNLEGSEDSWQVPRHRQGSMETSGQVSSGKRRTCPSPIPQPASTGNPRSGQDRLRVVWRAGEGPQTSSLPMDWNSRTDLISFFLSSRPRMPTRASLGVCGTASFKVRGCPGMAGAGPPTPGRASLAPGVWEGRPRKAQVLCAGGHRGNGNALQPLPPSDVRLWHLTALLLKSRGVLGTGAAFGSELPRVRMSLPNTYLCPSLNHHHCLGL